jgi:hypothetical protein
MFEIETSRHIPNGATKVADKLSDAVAYILTVRGRPEAKVFFGKQTKPVRFCVYRNEANREQDIKALFEARRAAIAYTLKRRDERKAWINDYKVGEIVNTCWGYDQTNCEFYEIVAVKGKHVTLRQIAVTSRATGWAQERVAPLAGEYIGESFERLASERGIKTGKHDFTYATRTGFTEAIPGLRVYGSSHTSSYA